MNEHDRLWLEGAVSSVSVDNDKPNEGDTAEIVATYKSGCDAQPILYERLRELTSLQGLDEPRYQGRTQEVDGITPKLVTESIGNTCASYQFRPSHSLNQDHKRYPEETRLLTKSSTEVHKQAKHYRWIGEPGKARITGGWLYIEHPDTLPDIKDYLDAVNIPSATDGQDLLRSFHTSTTGPLLIGIPGGLPPQSPDIRLGDMVVVSGICGKSLLRYSTATGPQYGLQRHYNKTHACQMVSKFLKSKVSVTKQPKQNNFVQKELPIVINTKTISARYDTGAEGNFMSKELAVKLGLRIDYSLPARVFKLPNGKKVVSIGHVQTSCSFARDPSVIKDCCFWIWENLAGSGLVMGRSFLNVTQTMSKYLYRLAPKIARSRNMLCSIESADSLVQRLYCKLDEKEVIVNPDTGSDLDIMSLEYARRAGYAIDRSVRREILLGDGTIVHSIGRVSDVLVSIGQSGYYCSFDVLSGMDLDITLGEQTLELLEVYTKHEDCFTMLCPGPRHYEMHTIVDRGLIGRLLDWSSWKRRRKKETTADNDTNVESDTTLFEACRRDRADHFIESLGDANPAVKQNAIQAEQAKRDLWDRKNQPP